MTQKTLSYLTLAATILVGIFAGVLITAFIAISPSLGLLDAANYTLVKQAQIHVLQVAMTLVSTLYCILAIWILIVAKREKNQKLYSYTLWALILVVIALAYSAFTDIPYNAEILKWDMISPPANWSDIRLAWDFANQVRTFPTLLAFMLQAAALLYVNDKAQK